MYEYLLYIFILCIEKQKLGLVCLSFDNGVLIIGDWNANKDAFSQYVYNLQSDYELGN